MDMDDTFRTIRADAEHQTKVKGSKFIAEACLAESVEAAHERLTATRKREHAATHHCWAYRIGHTAPFQFKYSDDGEPSGTAGRPILDVIEGAEITDVIVVVTRYYGGTKLGTGGLARAYSEVAAKAVEKAEIAQRYLTKSFRISLRFSYFDQARRLFGELEAQVDDADFSDEVAVRVTVRLSRAEQLAARIVELTQGKAGIEEI
jgi:uncharacterized YigZ family protein